VSANLDLVRSIYVDWELGDYSRTDWAHADIEFALADGPDPARWSGIAGMAKGWRAFQSAWGDDFRADPTEYIELDEGRVLVLVQFVGRAKGSGMELAQVHTRQASLLEIRDGKVTRLVLYWHHENALADLGLEA
jgi:ketosteroid isomerase-like protein